MVVMSTRAHAHPTWSHPCLQVAPRMTYDVTPPQGKLILNDVGQASWMGPQYPNSSHWDTYETVTHCTTATKVGCLFNIFDDPTEHHDLAFANPSKLQELLTKMKHAQLTVFDPDRGESELAAACDKVATTHGGFWGPFMPNP